MRLNALSRHDPQTAKAILAAAALSQDDVPYLSASAGRYDAEIREVIAEAESQLRIGRGDQDYEEKLRAFFSRQVVAAIMGDRKEIDVRTKMGREGRLPLSAYKVRFSKHGAKNIRENEKYIRRIIATATDFQHVTAVNSPAPELTKGMTLIVVPQDVGSNKEHWLLIDALRAGDALIVDDVLRVFPDVVDLDGVESPLDMLRAFVETYGRMFSIEGSMPAKMFEQLTFYKSEDDLKFDLLGEREFEVSVSGSSVKFDENDVPPGLAQVSCYIIAAYSLDRAKYVRDRNRFTKR